MRVFMFRCIQFRLLQRTTATSSGSKTNDDNVYITRIQFIFISINIISNALKDV